MGSVSTAHERFVVTRQSINRRALRSFVDFLAHYYGEWPAWGAWMSGRKTHHANVIADLSSL
jgi:hypothetical protein